MGFVMAMANAYGLFFVICFLGYGLVDIPRKLWAYGNRDVILRFEEEELQLAIEFQTKANGLLS